MEFSWLYITLSIFSFLMLMKLWKKQTPKNLPPGPPKLPLIGNLHHLTKGNTFPHRRLAELAVVHGPMMHLKLGEVSTVIISSAEMAKEVMKTHDAVFCSRPSLMLGRELFYGSSDIGLAPYGEYWRQVRKISVLELFTAKRVQSFRPIREEEVADLIESLRSQAGSVVNLSNKLFGLTFNITARATFNKKGKDQEEFRALTEDIFKLSSGFSVVDVFPSIEFLYSIFGMKRKFKELVRQSNRILDPIIEEHKSKKIDQCIGEEEDLVDVLLKFHKDNVKTPQQFSLTADNIKTIILELFSAGTETTSTALEWAISELLKNPKEMKKAQAEVRRVYEGETAVDEKKLHELTYLKLVIKETLRLHPPAPLLVPRESMDKCQINSYDIPSKTRVLINAWAIGRDPEFWPEPERFNPERFDNNSSVDYKGTNFELIPFGAGRRMCPGVALGMANVELPLAMLLYHFDWKLPSGLSPEYLDMNEAFGLTVRRKNDLQVIPIPYPY
ncbi:desmethyl-deoxy-podophyllotoxin synthase [Spinacia oleracea]|uniref:Desmethyl-deoxy-podophyllotoxin synthase n=1 Tax=Spinacia oleracea TaxID=3562 RepID=A0ABM3RGC6_SPIOL|nr:desmethyl-deoxy-podophyllotoxin synthase-like [Spinacia oleracea]